jgi:hypothetical protein
MWRTDLDDCFGGEDPLAVHLVRCRPLEEEEAEIIEAICLAATPGPLVTDEMSNGDGALVVTLPDGRNIVSMSPPPSGPEDAHCRASANAQLICEAHCWLLRLLRDRQWWKRREACLLERIRELESLLEGQYEAGEPAEWPHPHRAPAYPR